MIESTDRLANKKVKEVLKHPDVSRVKNEYGNTHFII